MRYAHACKSSNHSGPIGIDLQIVSYQSDSVREAVEGFVENLAAAVVIVVLVLILFMGWRSGVIVGSVLLLTVAGHF